MLNFPPSISKKYPLIFQKNVFVSLILICSMFIVNRTQRTVQILPPEASHSPKVPKSVDFQEKKHLVSIIHYFKFLLSFRYDCADLRIKIMFLEKK